MGSTGRSSFVFIWLSALPDLDAFPYLQRDLVRQGVFLTLHSVNTVEVINVTFHFKVTFTIQSCINQTLFLITRWIKNVKLGLFFFFSPPQDLELWLFSVCLNRGYRQSVPSFSSAFW